MSRSSEEKFNSMHIKPVFGPVGQAYCCNYYVPIHWTAWILTQSKNSDNELQQTMFHTENARLLCKSAVCALQPYASLLVGGLQGCHRKANVLMGTVQKHPLGVVSIVGTMEFGSSFLWLPMNSKVFL